jgi:pSer/pThr/pTyr-binding forkhead associated (FHA) protein
VRLVVRSGALKGQRVSIKTPMANIGRADYNDVHLPEESVSTSHAKLQRREGVWVLVDLESTNGTFVDGERVRGETALAPGALLRFGDVQVLFEPTDADDAMGVARGGGGSTKVLQAMKPSPPAKLAAPSPPPPPAAKAPVKPARAGTAGP